MTDTTDSIDWGNESGMTEEEAAANKLGFIRGPEITFSGQSGLYTHPDGSTTPFVEGYVFSNFENRLLYGGDGSAFPTIDTWICRCDYVGQSDPRYNEMLGPDILRRAQAMGGDGFGQDCQTCKLRVFGTDADGKTTRSECGARQALMFLVDDGQGNAADKAVPLNVKGKGLSPMWKFLKGDDFKNPRNGDQMPYMWRRVRLGSVKEKVGSKTFYVMTFAALELQTSRTAYNAMRQQGLELLKSAAKAAALVPRPPALAALPAPQAQQAYDDTAERFNAAAWNEVVDDVAF